MHLTAEPLWYVFLFVLSESCSSSTGHSSSFVLKEADAFTMNRPKRLWTISSLVPLSILISAFLRPCPERTSSCIGFRLHYSILCENDMK